MNCPHCGNPLALGAGFCGECGRPRPPMPPGFLEAERAYLDIQRRRNTGRLTEAAYEEALRGLAVTDGRGVWILGPDSGTWFYLAGEQWVPGDPAVAGTAPGPPPSSPPARAKPLRPRRRLVVGLAIGLPLGLLLLVALLAILTPVPRLLVYSFGILARPDDPELYFRRARLHYYDREDVPAALGDVSKALELGPLPFYYEWRAAIYEEQGRLDLALRDYESAIALDPAWSCALFFRRAELLRQLGRTAEARQSYQQVLAFPSENCIHHVEASAALLLLDLAESGIEEP